MGEAESLGQTGAAVPKREVLGQLPRGRSAVDWLNGGGGGRAKEQLSVVSHRMRGADSAQRWPRFWVPVPL